jgi:dTDP-4-dehydrorhamnose reductase
MKTLIFGASGMFGHRVVEECRSHFDTVGTIRDGDAPEALKHREVVAGVDVRQFETMSDLVRRVRPDAVVNCVGIVKQSPAAADPIASIEVNSLAPHRIAAVCRAIGARLIHISTDCVFSGAKGMYSEDEVPDAGDLYGRSKLLGEVTGDGALTLRTSIIGRELRSSSGLVEWFLSNRGGAVDGYDQAIFSGLTTIELSRVVARLIAGHPSLSGLYHVSAAPVSKLALLHMLNHSYGAGVMIRASSAVRIDRSLDSSRFRAVTGWEPPPWDSMVAELAADPTPYDSWRQPR